MPKSAGARRRVEFKMKFVARLRTLGTPMQNPMNLMGLWFSVLRQYERPIPSAAVAVSFVGPKPRSAGSLVPAMHRLGLCRAPSQRKITSKAQIRAKPKMILHLVRCSNSQSLQLLAPPSSLDDEIDEFRCWAQTLAHTFFFAYGP